MSIKSPEIELLCPHPVAHSKTSSDHAEHICHLSVVCVHACMKREIIRNVISVISFAIGKQLYMPCVAWYSPDNIWHLKLIEFNTNSS